MLQFYKEIKSTFVNGIITYIFEPKKSKEKLENWAANDNKSKDSKIVLVCELMPTVEECMCWKHCNCTVRNIGELGCI